MRTNQTIKLTFWEKNLLSKLTTNDPQLKHQHDYVDVYFYQPATIRNLETRGLIETNQYKDAARITAKGVAALANNLETNILTHEHMFNTQNG